MVTADKSYGYRLSTTSANVHPRPESFPFVRDAPPRHDSRNEDARHRQSPVLRLGLRLKCYHSKSRLEQRLPLGLPRNNIRFAIFIDFNLAKGADVTSEAIFTWPWCHVPAIF